MQSRPPKVIVAPWSQDGRTQSRPTGPDDIILEARGLAGETSFSNLNVPADAKSPKPLSVGPAHFHNFDFLMDHCGTGIKFKWDRDRCMSDLDKILPDGHHASAFDSAILESIHMDNLPCF